MLDKLRAEALALIAATPQCTLSTIGPAGVQASIVMCFVCQDCVYVLLPSTADHLFNLGHTLEVVLTDRLWQLRGTARLLCDTDDLGRTAWQEGHLYARSTGHTLIRVFPLRMHLEANDRRRYRETVDFDDKAFL